MRMGDNLQTYWGALAAPVAIALDATADVLALRASLPLRLIRFGAILSVECTGDLVMALDRSTHILDGTATRAEAEGGVTLAGAAHEVGAIIYADLLEDVLLKPGDIAHLEITDAYTAGDGYPFIQFQQLNWKTTGPESEFADATPQNRMFDGSTAT